MLTTLNLSTGAVAGAALGAVLSVTLLPLALRGGETTELALVLATALGMPVSALAMALESRNVSFWISFGLAFLGVPLNGALIGAIVGASAHAAGWHARAAFAAIPVLWLAILTLTAWWMRSH